MPVLVWVVACDAIEEAMAGQRVACDDSSEEGAAVVQRVACRTVSRRNGPRRRNRHQAQGSRCPVASGVVAVRDGVAEGCSLRQLVYINAHN